MHRLLVISAMSSVFFLTSGITKGHGQQDTKVVDKEFLIKTVTDNQAEVKASEVAEKRTSNSKVKDFARRMVRQHTGLNETLSQIGKDEKIAILAGTEKETKDLVDRLSKLSGNDLDREYLKAMIDAHQRAIERFDWQGKHGSDAKLNEFANKTLPDLRENLKEARALFAEIK